MESDESMAILDMGNWIRIDVALRTVVGDIGECGNPTRGEAGDPDVTACGGVWTELRPAGRVRWWWRK